jgi:hypothetical protein
MIELTLLEADAVAAECLEVEVDDVVLPPELTVGDRLEPERLLQRHHLADGVVFGFGKRRLVDLFLAVTGTGIHQALRPAQAADVICPERRVVRRRHVCFLFFCRFLRGDRCQSPVVTA